MELKNRLIELRNSRSISMKDVANGSGIPYNTYIKYEYGTRELSLAALEKLANFYDMTTDDILGRSDKVESRSDSQDLKPLEQVLLKKYLQLPDTHRDAILDMISNAVHDVDSNT